MTTGTVSGVVPVHNGERFLAEALESMLGQSLPLLEVIVIDDGSTDGTAEVAASFGDRVRYVHQDNAGPSIARNAGIAIAQGALITFLDADDIWHREKVASQVARFEERPELDYCVTAIQNFWMDEVAEEGERFASHPRGKPMPGYITQTLMVRRRAFDAIGVFDTRLKHVDAADWFLRAREHGAIEEYLPEVLTYRRMHRRNRSREKATTSLDESLEFAWRAMRKARKQDEADESPKNDRGSPPEVGKEA